MNSISLFLSSSFAIYLIIIAEVRKDLELDRKKNK